MTQALRINKFPSDSGKRNFLGRSEEAIREHFQKMGMVFIEIQDSKGRRQLEINEFAYYNVRYLLVNNICRWVYEKYIDDEHLESLRKYFNNSYKQVNEYSWVEFSPRTDYLHTLHYSNNSLALNHFLALCFVPAYNLLGYNLREIKHWLFKNKNVLLERTHSIENGCEAWMAFWHGVGMVFEIIPGRNCSKIIFYLPGGYKDFLEELMNEYLIPAGDKKWIQETEDKTCDWTLVKDTGSDFWEMYLTELPG